jgi:leader peptidase (prepilin peptidase)/N-methyltransferase
MSLDLAETLSIVVPLAFAFAFGACVGSLINVLVYRLPLGLSVITPPSRCPSCETRLTWRENIPVLGWILLRGRCRFCKSRISAEYPLVEAFVGLLFVGLYAMCFLLSPDASILGVPLGAIRPEWGLNGFVGAWPIFIVVAVLFASLTAMTIVDARTFTIPLELAWFATAVALILHTAWAIVVEFSPGGGLAFAARDWDWAIATPWGWGIGQAWGGWQWVGASLGGTIGLGLSLLLLRLGLLRRSFEDYAQWEAQHAQTLAAKHPGAASPPPDRSAETGPLTSLDAPPGPPTSPASASAVAPAHSHANADLNPTDLWVAYPHARREMIREMAFLGAPVGLAYLGAIVMLHLAGQGGWIAPLWLKVLSGVLLGFLVGGGVVWFVRILGSLAFGKEAMGLGDVHLMAAVGAALGWIDAVLAFFLAAFVGVAWAIFARVAIGSNARAMPYGPFLAIATLLVFVAKPAIELGLSHLFVTSVPMNLP